jgi:hypothetical protein
MTFGFLVDWGGVRDYSRVQGQVGPERSIQAKTASLPVSWERALTVRY